MVSVVEGPSWFSATGVSLEIVGAIILGVIAIHVLRYYTLTKKYKWVRLGVSFALLSAATLFDAILSIGLQVKPIGILDGGVIAFVLNEAHARTLLFFGGVVFMEFLLIIGLYLLWTSYHETSKTMHALVAFLVGLVLYFATDAYYVFHLLGLVFTTLIVTALISHYRKYRRSSTLMLIAGFSCLVASRLLFIFVLFSGLWFVAASLLQVIGLLLILITFAQVVALGKKKSA